MNEVITSNTNPRIKFAKSLLKKKTRDEYNLFSIEGDTILRDAIGAQEEFNLIFIDVMKMEKYDDIIKYADDNLIEIVYVASHVMQGLCNTKTPRGVFAILKKTNLCFDAKRIEEISFIAILDKLSDPGNLGTIIRTCDAVGVQALLLGNNCVDIYNDKVVRASMGSLFNIDCYTSDDLVADINSLKNDGWQVACGHLNGMNFFDRVQGSKVALVIGNESNGISDEVIKVCSGKWKLPMHGGAESLNAAIASGIMLYDISRKANK